MRNAPCGERTHASVCTLARLGRSALASAIRPAWICCALAGVVVLLGCTRAKPPDVVFITLDTTRADHLGVYGHARPTSPEIDRFARDGVTFRRAWSTAPWTLPSHASMFTGQLPRTHGARFNEDGEEMFGNRVSRLSEDATTLAEVLGGRGYATAAFAGGPWLAPEFGLLQGYQHRWAGLPSGESVVEHVKRVREFKNEVDWGADELTDRAVAWLATVPDGQPIHLLVNYFDPHEPYRTQAGFEVDAPTPGWKRHRRSRLRYDSEIRFVDHHFGRLLQALKDDGRYDDALIVVVADHGESFGEHGNGGHGPWLYEEVLRVPLLIHFPKGRDAGTVVDAPVSTVDLLPLVAREVGFPVPPNVEGVPIGERELVLAEAHRSKVFTRLAPDVYDRDLVAAIRWPWKLIVPDVGGVELYRLDDDPTELRDREGDAAQAELRADLDRALTRLPPPAKPAAPGKVDPELTKRLRELGYIE